MTSPRFLVTVACLGIAAPLLARNQAAPVSQTPPYSALVLQVQLARAGFSPGEIDGKDGINTTKALAAYVEFFKDSPSAGTVEGALESYVITAADVDGPFVDIPADMMAKVKLRTLGYSSMMEALGERFHSAPALLLELNPGVKFVAGATVKVPRVATVETTSVEAARIFISKGESSVRVYDALGKLLFYAPVTSGSEHDPLPLGDWTVTTILKNPTFNYNPDLFWDANPAHSKATIPAGPNGPVGVVWIDISKEHYGLHGTPEPGRIGYSDSHGCVRLTNWDALTLAGFVKKGTPVKFVA